MNARARVWLCLRSRRLTQWDICDDHSGHPKRLPHDSGKMRSTIRSATLSGYAELARSVGLDPHRLMRKCGLDPSCLSDPDARIDAAAVAKLLETSAAESRVEDFGLRLSKARRLSNLGPFSLVVREETTARRALETLGRYLQLHSEMLSIRIEDAGNLVILRVDIVPGGADASPAGDRTLRGLSVPHLARVAGAVMEAAARSVHALAAREPVRTCRRVRAHRRL